MVKQGKKRRRKSQDNVDLLCNITGLQGSTIQGDQSMEDCLAELAGVQEQQDTPKNKAAKCDTAQSSSSHHDKSKNEWRLNAFQSWVTTGKYTEGLPNPRLEVSRHFHTEQLSCFLLKTCPSLRMPAFERWWIDSKWKEYEKESNRGDDPVLSCYPSLESEASQRLVEEVVHGGETRENAQRIVQDLCLRTKHAAQELAAMSLRRLLPLGKGAHIELEKGSSQYTLSYTRKSWKKPFRVKLNAEHYDKLREAFLQIHPSLKKEKRLLQPFHILVFCLLLRYSSLSGGHLINDLRGGGMQGAVHPQVFQVLERFFPTQDIMECFASPWNAHLPVYASAFQDLDAHFGSTGDFRECIFREGVYEANPPFSPGLMLCMAEYLIQSLMAADEESNSLTFVVVVPTANNSEKEAPPAKQHAQKSFSLLTESPHCGLHMILPSRQHGYVEGAQHLRPTRYKQSPYDTSLILLQSEAASKELLDHETFQEEIRSAFASRHEKELQNRREGEDTKCDS